MKQVITAKLKLQTDSTQFKALRATQLAYRDALNSVSQYAYAHGKMSNKVGLQQATYQQIRTQFKLPAQMACSVPRQVGATYKALWTKVKQNEAARKAGLTKKRYQGLDAAARDVSPTLTYQLGHDYSFKKGQRVSSTMKGEPTFQSGVVVAKANHYARLRKRLQQKGTRAATRRLVHIRQRERRGTARR